jgi:hypothetical protein
MGLPESGQAFDEYVATGEDGGDQMGYEFSLSDDYTIEQRTQVLELAMCVGVGAVGCGSCCQRLCLLAFIHACT